MSSRSPFARVLLIPDPRPVESSPGARRYRLARLAVNPGQRPEEERFGHIKRCYD
jgi:hypothetical protein